MRRIFQLSVLCLAAGVVTACEPEETIPTETAPTAGVRFVHAVPDTGAMDFRPVDIVENTHFYQVGFRGTALLYYKNARAGARKFRIFMNGNTQAVASTVVKDIDVTLEPGKNYTFIIWGNARTGSTPAMTLTILTDDPADPGSQVALRILNATGAAIDGKQYPSTGAAPATATWANVAPLTVSTYVAAAPGAIRYRVEPAGGGTALFADAVALAGAPATGPGGVLCPPSTTGCDRDALPGTTLPGSGVSGIVFPRSVAGSLATNFTTPGIIFVWDRRPPRLAGL